MEAAWRLRQEAAAWNTHHHHGSNNSLNRYYNAIPGLANSYGGGFGGGDASNPYYYAPSASSKDNLDTYRGGAGDPRLVSTRGLSASVSTGSGGALLGQHSGAHGSGHELSNLVPQHSSSTGIRMIGSELGPNDGLASSFSMSPRYEGEVSGGGGKIPYHPGANQGGAGERGNSGRGASNSPTAQILYQRATSDGNSSVSSFVSDGGSDGAGPVSVSSSPSQHFVGKF